MSDVRVHRMRDEYNDFADVGDVAVGEVTHVFKLNRFKKCCFILSLHIV